VCIRGATALSTGLLENGVRAGDWVALHLNSGPEMIAAYYACFTIGRAIAAPLRRASKFREVAAVSRPLKPNVQKQSRNQGHSI
jgi:acyl-CoA synthetase (AMP-forming)/AMP-acid ligase II